MPIAQSQLAPIVRRQLGLLTAFMAVDRRGGHVVALEEPELLVDDIRAFFRRLR